MSAVAVEPAVLVQDEIALCLRNVAALFQALPLHVIVIVGLRLSQT